ncbi:MAG: sugar ABC transporter substrate-binding protein [Anaerolineaceae bacterium]
MKKLKWMLLIVLACSLILASCSQGAAADTEEVAEDAVAEETVPEKTEFTIGLSWNAKNLTLVQAWEDYMKEIADETAAAEGYTVTWVINVAESDPTRQASNIEDLISQGVDVIIARAEDGAAICSSIAAAKEAGIPFITFDRESQGCEPDGHVGADSLAQAVSTAETFAELLKANGVTGQCIELVGDLADQNAVNRSEGWAQVEEESGAWTTVLQVLTEYDPEIFNSGTKNGFTEYPDANCMFITTDAGWGIVQNALEEMGKLHKTGEEGHIWIASQDVDLPGYQGLMEGYMDVSTSYDAYYHSFELVKMAFALARGETLESTNVLVSGRVVTSENVRDTEDLWARDYGDYKE